MAAVTGPKVVVIGAGTGTFTILTALKYYARDITAIVNMSDDGGSTGILRDELGALPPGDVRQCLVALSESDQKLRDLFNYRFDEGTFGGHSFGNIFLSALEKTTGSFADAVKTAGEILNISGHVVPVTLSNVKLVLTKASGEVVKGEYQIVGHDFDSNRPQLSLEPNAQLNPEAKTAIEAADIVVIAPGNLYTSLAPTLIVSGMSEALAKTRAKLVYISNLVTKPGQTDGFKVDDYVREIERFIGSKTVDYVIYNSHKPSDELLRRYAKAGEFAVEFDPEAFKKHHAQAIGEDLVSAAIPQLKPSEQLIPRTLIRHDSDKVARLIMRVYFS
ncbi:MAG TPA: gluconeogenesis factor YvcK family protein [Candidatus Saccharimonadia bacterium]|nr:gluconeogenesis factor YvcK family protein [Candidatus Saccharimonadia bacterium]